MAGRSAFPMPHVSCIWPPPKDAVASHSGMARQPVLAGKGVTRQPWKNAWTSLVLGVALTIWIPRPTGAKAIGLVSTAEVTDPSPPSSARSREQGDGVLRFEVEPDDVEIYLDEQYLGWAGELRGRAVEGILVGNRLLELRWGTDRTFLQVLVSPNGTKTIRVNLAPSGPGGSPSSPGLRSKKEGFMVVPSAFTVQSRKSDLIIGSYHEL